MVRPVVAPLLAVGALALQALPPPLAVDGDGQALESLVMAGVPRTVYITSELASRRDSEGLTLIPPSGREFAETFVEDLASLTDDDGWRLEVVDQLPAREGGIHLDVYQGELQYENGERTEEGYELEVKSKRSAVIRGTGARGMWWGTRTLLQNQLLSGGGPGAGKDSRKGDAAAAVVRDAPAYATRAFMLDAGRKWYAPSFLKDMCTYASFFKMSEFHYHTSDNYPLSRGQNATWQDVYAQFSLHPESESLQGLVQRANETLDRATYQDLEQHCASRGITVIPEIEAPGHCLTITKWKPELALDKKDLLNLTHPDSIPTVKAIWADFLPWFRTKEVHIGADEYDATLADDYIRFVNEMEAFVRQKSGKRIRIWGTHEPSNTLTINKDIIIQHWQYGQSDPVALQADGYETINSQDWWAYMTLKNDHTPILPAPYPQFFNESRTLNFGGRPGWQWHPALFNNVNLTEQLEPGAAGLRGAITAAWNDNGPDPTTQLEAYYALRRGIPLVAARAWSGARGPPVNPATVSRTIDFLSPRVPGANLDRVLRTPTSPRAGAARVSWEPVPATGTGRSGTTHLGYGSKGMNYTLELEVAGPFTLDSADATLTLDDGGRLVFTSDGWEYPLRSVGEHDGFDAGHPGRIWVNTTTSTHDEVRVRSLPTKLTMTGDVIGGSRVWLDGQFAGRFEAFVYGGQNLELSWSQMAFVAPLDTLQGGITKLILVDRVEEP